MTKARASETLTETEAKAAKFAADNTVLDRANQNLEAHRGILPPMTWEEALRQARRETHPHNKQPSRKHKLLFFL